MAKALLLALDRHATNKTSLVFFIAGVAWHATRI
jgi:hypothetical protein